MEKEKCREGLMDIYRYIKGVRLWVMRRTDLQTIETERDRQREKHEVLYVKQEDILSMKYIYIQSLRKN